jgi:hypothetical protein
MVTPGLKRLPSASMHKLIGHTYKCQSIIYMYRPHVSNPVGLYLVIASGVAIEVSVAMTYEYELVL